MGVFGARKDEERRRQEAKPLGDTVWEHPPQERYGRDPHSPNPWVPQGDAQRARADQSSEGSKRSPTSILEPPWGLALPEGQPGGPSNRVNSLFKETFSSSYYNVLRTCFAGIFSLNCHNLPLSYVALWFLCGVKTQRLEKGKAQQVLGLVLEHQSQGPALTPKRSHHRAEWVLLCPTEHHTPKDR